MVGKSQYRWLALFACMVAGVTTLGEAPLGGAPLGVTPLGAQTLASVEDQIFDFVTSQDKGTRMQAVADLTNSGVSFEEVLSLLRDPPGTPGRTSGEVQTGQFEVETDIGLRDSTIFRAMILVPESYDPGRSYPVRVYLHGGVQRSEWRAGDSWWRRLDLIARDDAISIIPASWSAHPWWRWSQVRHLQLLLERVRLEYNTDENRVALFGVSDGGTGAYYLASHWTTPWAAVLPFISHPAVLANPGVAPDGATFPMGLRNKPLFVVSGDSDRLYPTQRVEPFIADFKELGVSINYRGLAGVGHETSWWPKHAEDIDQFIDDNPRVPHPKNIWWVTDSPGRYGRAHWIVIEDLGSRANEAEFSVSRLMPPQGRHGRIKAMRQGNSFIIETQGVSSLRLLLSPDVVDFGAVITVTVNGALVYDAVVVPSVGTILKWAARDRDRTMLYGAELEFSVP